MHLDIFEFSLAMFVLIAITSVLETIVEKVEHYVRSLANHHYMQLFNKMTTELMLLGVISFTIFMSEIGFHLQTKPYYIELEVAHLFLFFMGVILVAQCLTLLEYMRTFVHFWAKSDVKSTEELARLCDKADSMPFWQRVKLREELRFHIIKHEFITNKMLPKDFAFVSYLDKSVVGMVCHGVHIDTRYWIAICVLIWLNYLRTKLMAVNSTTNEHRRLAGGGLVPDPGPFPEWGMWVFVILGYMLLAYGLGIYYWTGPVVVDQFTKEALRHAQHLDDGDGDLEGDRGEGKKGKGDYSFNAFKMALRQIDDDHEMYSSLLKVQQEQAHVLTKGTKGRASSARSSRSNGAPKSSPMSTMLSDEQAMETTLESDEYSDASEDEEVKLLPALTGPVHTPEVRRQMKRQPSVLIVERYEGARKVHMASRHINKRASLIPNTSLRKKSLIVGGAGQRKAGIKAAVESTGKGMKKVVSRGAMVASNGAHSIVEAAKQVGISHAIQVHLHTNRMERVAVCHQFLLLFNIFYTVAFLCFYMGIMSLSLTLICLVPISLLWLVVIPLASKSAFFLQAVAMHNEEILGEVKLEELDVLNGIDMMAKHIEQHCSEVAAAAAAEMEQETGLGWAAGKVHPMKLKELFEQWTALPRSDYHMHSTHGSGLRSRLGHQASRVGIGHQHSSSDQAARTTRTTFGSSSREGSTTNVFSGSISSSNDDSLNAYKLKVALTSIGLAVDQTRVNLIFIGLDDDRDGLIQWQEFEAKVIPHCSPRFQRLNGKDDGTPSIAPSLFGNKIKAIRKGLKKEATSMVKSARQSMRKPTAEKKADRTIV
jgi:hypothetical protein